MAQDGRSGLMRGRLLATALVLAAGIAVLPFYRCPFRAATGLLCPGCGMTHAVLSLLHGEFAGAAHHNALIFLPLAGIPAVIRAKRAATYSLIGIAVAFAVARNLRPDWLGIG